MNTRRNLLKSIGATATVLALGINHHTQAAVIAGGYGINAHTEGLNPGSDGDQGAKLQKILERAAQSNMPVFVPPGRYKISNLVLPANTRLAGVPGATHLEFAGGEFFLYGEGGHHIELSGLVIDGALKPFQADSGGAIQLRQTRHVAIENCEIKNAALDGLHIEQSEGRIANNRLDNILGYAGIFAVENTGIRIEDNSIQECANAGILVHRYTKGPDNTIVSGNRIRNIAAIKGGTGQYGNGINLANSDGVIVSNNHVSDCSFSTIRCFSSSNVQITNNTCLRAGETSVYAEFEFQGALIEGNIVDGAGTCGISIANLDHGGRLTVCANNLVRNIDATRPYEDNVHMAGMGISAEADIAITGNVIENTKNFGMTLGWGEYLRNVTANANVIRNSDVGVAVSVVEGNGPTTITNNMFARLRQGGVIGYQWLNAVTDDLAVHGPGPYQHLVVANNSVA